MKNLFLTYVFVLIGILHSPSTMAAPDFEWQVLETKHFEVIYHAPQKELALMYAFAAEESYKILSEVFSDLPKKTVLALDDGTDLTNGSATFLPYNWITIYPALPNPGESLDEYGFWPTSIMIHELTHIANFQPASGFYTPLLYLMGRIITPNALLPRWYLEGLAVDSESRYTSFGRLRSSRTQGILRALSVENKFKSFGIDQINEVLTNTWPFGERPYYFGSLLQKSLVDQGSKDLRERWNQRYGRRVPFIIDAVARDDFDKNYAQLLADVYQDYQERSLKQIEEIKKDGEFKTIAYQKVEHEQYEPAVSPDGMKLIYISKSYRRNGIWLIEKKSEQDSFSTLKPKLLLNVGSPIKLEWQKDSSGFYFDEVDMDSPFKSYRKIYHFGLDQKRKTLVTPDLRGQEPGLHPTAKKFTFIGSLENGQRYLGLYSFETNQYEVLYTAKLQERLSRPLFIDETRILFSHRTLSGQDTLLEYDTVNKATSKKGIPLSQFRTPTLNQSEEGQKLLLLSNTSGIDNLFEMNLGDKKTTSKTNSLTWIHSYSWPEKTYPLIISQMTGAGLRLFETGSNSYQLKSKHPLVQFKKRPEEALPTTENTKELVVDERSFYPFKYLLPTYLLPFIYPLDGGVIVQGSTSAADPVGVNQYLLSGSYDSLTEKGSYGLAYMNQSFPTSIGLQAAQFQEHLGASDISFEKRNLGGEFTLPISRRWLIGTGYEKTTSKLNSNQLEREGPEVFSTYSSLLDRRYSEFGSLASVSFKKFLHGPDRVAYDKASFSLGQKASLPFKGDHSLWLGIKGSFSNQLPRQNILSFGDRSLGANYLVNLTESQFLYRGYPSGSLIGRQLLNGNLEYRFPINELFYGNGTTALFFRSLSGVFFVDAMAVDGLYYEEISKNTGAYRDTGITEIHPSTGAELRLDTNLAYHLPITFILGGYYGMSRQMGENFSLFIGIGGQDPLSEVASRHFP